MKFQFRNIKGVSVGVLFLWLLFDVVMAQSIKGLVLDAESKWAIAGVSVFLPEANYGTLTNEKGEFLLKNPPNSRIVLQLSMVGYESQMITTNIGAVVEVLLVPSHIHLQEVVVVSSSQGKLQNENIMHITQKTVAELTQNAPNTLSEALTNIAGVEQLSTGVGISKPIIRGLTGSRIVTYAQDMRIENQQWGDEHGLGVGEVGIERIEVIRGPASLLYGADALGGVLYFIDERYTSPKNVAGFVQSNFRSNSLGLSHNFGLKIHQNKLKWNVFGQYGADADYYIPNGERVNNSRYNEGNLKTSVGYATQKLTTHVRYSFLSNTFGILPGDSLYSRSTLRAVELPFQKIMNHNLSWNNTLFLANSKVNLVIGYTHNNRTEFDDIKNTAALAMNLQTLTYNLKWYIRTKNESFDFIVGSQGMYQDNRNLAIKTLIPNATTKDLGVFWVANADWNKLKLQGGLRLDIRTINTTPKISDSEVVYPALHRVFVNPNFSIGALYSLKKIDVRLNISKGFRTPNTAELLSNGIHEGTFQYLLGNTGLTSENATQLDLSAVYQSEHLSVSLNPFVNRIADYIYLSPTNTRIANRPAYGYRQQNAVLYGGEAGLHYHPHKIHWLHIESSLSATLGRGEGHSLLPLMPATRLSSTVKVEFRNHKKIQITNVSFNHIYKFSQNRVALFETQTPRYQLVNIHFNIEIKTRRQPIEVYCSLKNVFNTRYIDHLSRFKTLNIPNQGFNIGLGGVYKFG
jgi:iron complex outermembrane recepter protein